MKENNKMTLDDDVFKLVSKYIEPELLEVSKLVCSSWCSFIKNGGEKMPAVRDILICAISYGYEDVVKYILETNFGKPFISRAYFVLRLIANAIGANQLNIAIYFCQKIGLMEGQKTLEDSEELKVIYSKYKMKSMVCAFAADRNKLEILKFFHKQFHVKFDSDLIVYGLENNSAECVRYILDNGCEYYKMEDICEDASVGCLKILKWAHEEKGYPLSSRCVSFALSAKHNRIEILKYLLSKGLKFVERANESAAGKGDLELLKFVRQNMESGWNNKNATAEASKVGNLECLKFLIEEGCEYDLSRCLEIAKQNNNSDITVYLQQLQQK